MTEPSDSIAATEQFLEELARVSWASSGAVAALNESERLRRAEEVDHHIGNLLAYLTPEDRNRLMEIVVRLHKKVDTTT